MKDARKTKQQLISELNALRRQMDSPPSTAAESGTTTAAGEPSGDRFEILFNHDQDALVILDAHSGTIINVNQSAWKILGYENTDLVDKKLKDLFRLGSGKDAARLKGQLQIHGNVFTRIYLHPDGANRFLDLTAAIIPWATGRAILVTARDITERKAFEDRLAELFQQIQKGEVFFASIHVIFSYLSIIICVIYY